MSPWPNSRRTRRPGSAPPLGDPGPPVTPMHHEANASGPTANPLGVALFALGLAGGLFPNVPERAAGRRVRAALGMWANRRGTAHALRVPSIGEACSRTRRRTRARGCVLPPVDRPSAPGTSSSGGSLHCRRQGVSFQPALPAHGPEGTGSDRVDGQCGSARLLRATTEAHARLQDPADVARLTPAADEPDCDGRAGCAFREEVE